MMMFLCICDYNSSKLWGSKHCFKLKSYKVFYSSSLFSNEEVHIDMVLQLPAFVFIVSFIWI